MTILSNVDIKECIKYGNIKITPYDLKNIQGATVDLRLGGEFLISKHYSRNQKDYITLDSEIEYHERNKKFVYILPGDFILGTTLENISLSPGLCARVDGKSGVGRKGLFIQNAGHIGPGFKGEITLEIYNANRVPMKLEKGRKICQIEFHELKTPSTRPYEGKYQGQKGPKI